MPGNFAMGPEVFGLCFMFNTWMLKLNEKACLIVFFLYIVLAPNAWFIGSKLDLWFA